MAIVLSVQPFQLAGWNDPSSLPSPCAYYSRSSLNTPQANFGGRQWEESVVSTLVVYRPQGPI